MPRDQAQKSVWRRRVGWGVGISGASLGLVWVLVHSTTWAGPLLANTLRRIVGTDNVARIEDFVYGVEDRITQIRRRGEKPKAHWVVPAPKPKASASAPSENQVLWPPFEPQAVGPVHKKWSAPGDGQWVAVEDPRHPNAQTAMYKTLVHPDPNRSWGELFVVAIDLEQTDLRAAAGTQEPKAEPPIRKDFPRPGRIPAEHHAALLGAFNGGFMAEHGHYGMFLNGTTLVKPRDTSCTVIGYNDGTIEIATWKSVAHAAGRMNWFRQTPACMFENGTMHVGLRYPETRLWGATLDGDTVIRRSAIGLSESRRILYVGIGNSMTARALAEGMRHAGAVDVAQLDVNWSYPKFLVYEVGKSGALEAHALMDGFEFSPGEYISKSSLRDFFYVTRRDQPRTSHTPSQSTERAAEVANLAAATSTEAGASAAPAASTTESGANAAASIPAVPAASANATASPEPTASVLATGHGAGIAAAAEKTAASSGGAATTRRRHGNDTPNPSASGGAAARTKSSRTRTPIGDTGKATGTPTPSLAEAPTNTNANANVSMSVDERSSHSKE